LGIPRLNINRVIYRRIRREPEFPGHHPEEILLTGRQFMHDAGVFEDQLRQLGCDDFEELEI
jgi:hypothetical protein